MAKEEQPNYGYPVPGPQYITSDEVMNEIFFLTDEKWHFERRKANYDYVIIGSSFCALAFVKRALKNNPDAKIIIIERGGYYLPQHFQNLPPAFMMTVEGAGETFPWRITKDTHEGEYIKWQHGVNNFFGGKSSFWSGWCPEPTDEDMSEWPDETKEVVKRYFPAAKELLKVIPADQISKEEHGKDSIYGELQDDVYEMLKDISTKIEAITESMPAPLAVKADMYRNINYEKFSVPGPLLAQRVISGLDIKNETTKESTLKIVINCVVNKIRHNKGKPIVLETSKGDFVLGNAKLILAMGTLPPTTLMLNSFPKCDFPSMRNIGERFTAHFVSSIIARIPAKLFPSYSEYGTLEMGAVYIAGKDKKTNHQFHIQLSAIYNSTPMENVFDTIRHLPDVIAAPSIEQMVSSKGHVVFVCAVLGELDHNNDKNWFRKNDDNDLTSNVTLQVVANGNDNDVWDTMEDSTYQMLETLASKSKSELEYWHTDGWKYEKPKKDHIRVPSIVHEASTMWLGKDGESPVDLNYCFKGVENVYLTGASLWPTSGSWNPACTISAIAMHLADLLSRKAVPLLPTDSK